MRSPSASPRRSIERLGDGIERIEVAGPGFLNLFVSEAWLRGRRRRDRRGSAIRAGSSRRSDGPLTLVEFVSANPTGPITVAFGPSRRLRRLPRAGSSTSPATGSSASTTSTTPAARSELLRRLDRRANDRRGRSRGRLPGRLRRRAGRAARGEGSTPADGDALAERGVELMLESIRSSLERFRVDFDRWLSERALRDAGAVEAGIDALRERGARLRERGRALDPHHRVRRRQGPGPRPCRWRADLLRSRHRLSPRQARARSRR